MGIGPLDPRGGSWEWSNELDYQTGGIHHRAWLEDLNVRNTTMKSPAVANTENKEEGTMSKEDTTTTTTTEETTTTETTVDPLDPKPEEEPEPDTEDKPERG